MIILITGAAGSGKTFLIDLLKNKHKTIKLIKGRKYVSFGNWHFTGYSNQAATNVGKTVHTHYGFNPSEESEKPEWFDEESRVSNRENVVVIDEASMLNQRQLELMVKARPATNFILVGDFNQLLPVKGDPIQNDWIDKVYVIDEQWRSIDASLDRFLQGLLNNKIDWQFIENHKAIHGPDAKTLFVTYFHKNITEYEKLWTIRHNSPVRGKDFMLDEKGQKQGIRSRKETRIVPWWFKNEYFNVDEINDDYVVLINDRIMSNAIINREVFDDYFSPAYTSTFYECQGITRRGRTIVHIDSLLDPIIDADTRMRCLYVACSRVTSADDLEFAYDDIERIKPAEWGYTYHFTGLSETKVQHKPDLVSMVDSDCLCFGLSKVTESLVCTNTEKGEMVQKIKSLDSLHNLITDAQRKERKALCLAYIEEELKEAFPAPNKELARRLNVSPRTIRNYIEEMKNDSK